MREYGPFKGLRVREPHPHDGNRVRPPAGRFLDDLRAERRRRQRENDAEFERFLGVQKGTGFKARSRLWASWEYFYSEAYLASFNHLDWQHVPRPAQAWAGLFDHLCRKDGVPLAVLDLSPRGIRIGHGRYLAALDRDEMNYLIFRGWRAAEKIGIDVRPGQWRGAFDPLAWTWPFDGQPENPGSPQRSSLRGLYHTHKVRQVK